MDKIIQGKFFDRLRHVFTIMADEKDVINKDLIERMMSNTKAQQLFVQAFTSKDFDPKGKNNDIYEKLGDKRWDSCMTLLFSLQSTEVGGEGIISDAKSLALVTDKAKSNYYMDHYMDYFGLKIFVLKLDNSEQKVYADAFEALVGVLFVNIMMIEDDMGIADRAIYQLVRYIFKNVTVIDFKDPMTYMSDITLVKEWGDIVNENGRYTKSQEQNKHRGTLVLMGHTITAKGNSEKEAKNLVYAEAVKVLKIDKEVLKARKASKDKGVQSSELKMPGIELPSLTFVNKLMKEKYSMVKGAGYKVDERNGRQVYQVEVLNGGKPWINKQNIPNTFINAKPIGDVAQLMQYMRIRNSV